MNGEERLAKALANLIICGDVKKNEYHRTPKNVKKTTKNRKKVETKEEVK